MPKQLQDSVVVITGGSSGIGRATAHEFARKGANVVVAARRDSLLQDVVNECKELSGRGALAVPTDVQDEQSVQNLAQQAFNTFGRIDVWINDAGVGAFGRFEEVPPAIFREVLETNFFGTVYGARAVLPFFRKQQEGTLINISSLLGTIGGAYYTAYTSSKFAVRAFGEGLREEIQVLDGAKNIHICTVFPATIDTPFFHHAANYTGRAVQAMPPVYPVEQVAKTLVKLAVKPQRETYVGNAARMIGFTHNVAPGLAEIMMAKQIDTSHFKPESSPTTDGAVASPMQTGTDVSGGWQGGPKSIARTLAAVGVATATTGVLTWVWLRNRNGQ